MGRQMPNAVCHRDARHSVSDYTTVILSENL